MLSWNILVLDKGKVAEYDTPSKLIEQGGIFASLVEESKSENSWRSWFNLTFFGIKIFSQPSIQINF